MPSDVELKPALTFEQQMELLEKKGLVITHSNEEIQFLNDNNYYRLNIYFHKLMDSRDHFIPGTRFSNVINIYQNDRFLRQQIFSMLEPIEIDIKTKVSYFLGNKYGPKVFYEKGIYKSPQKYEQIMNTFCKEISRNESDSVIKHHHIHYSGFFPIWVIVEYLSFNCISNYFINLMTEDQKSIAISYFGINERLLGNWMHSLSVMRNICAHFGYLFKRVYTVPISFGYDSKIYINQGNTLFGIFYTIKKLSRPDRWSDFYSTICDKVGEAVLVDQYNFPHNLSGLAK